MRYGTLNRSTLYALVDALGEDAAKLIATKAMQQAGFQSPKYGDIAEGQLEVLLNIIFTGISPERLSDVLAHRLIPSWVETIPLLVDYTGRCIPEGLTDRVLPPNKSFRLDQPTYDTTRITQQLDRLKEFWPFQGAECPSADEVETRYREILAWLNTPEHEESGIKNLLKGVHLLGIMPKLKGGDHGTIVEALVEAAGRSYLNQFPKRQFYNHRRGELANQVEIAEGTRYSEFVRRATEESVIWLSFRTCLQSFSIPAQRQQETKMPQRLILSGAWDTAADMIACPDVLARGYNTPGLDCAANSWRGGSLYFRAYDDGLDFNGRDLYASDGYSGGLVVLG